MNFCEKTLRSHRAGAPVPVPLPPQKRVFLPLEWGETALVETGEHVLLGQRIADGAGETVPVHASVSGTVSAVVPHTCAGGRRCTTIVLESDGKNQPAPSIHPRPLLEGLSPELLLNLLYESGIRLPGGAPLASAIASTGREGPALAVSAMNAGPGLCAEEAVVLYERETFLSGVWLIERLLRPRAVYLLLGQEQRTAIHAARRWAERLRLRVVRGAWPAAHPRRLASLFGENGEEALVLPASAAVACARAAYEGMPVLRQTVCVNWGSGRTLLDAPLGAPVRALLDAAGVRAEVVLVGDALTGRRLRNLDVPVVKGMEALTLLPRVETPVQTACIRCGRCAAVCPMGLRPWLSQRRGARRDWGACLRCGACEYACPAGRPLLRDMLGREALCHG